MSLAILFHFLCAQHVSDINISIIRSLRLFCWIITLQAEAWNTYTTPTQPHRNSNTHRTKKNTTNVVIQQNSRKLLMMDILMSETCWAHKKWNKIASDIKLVFYSSNVYSVIFHCFVFISGGFHIIYWVTSNIPSIKILVLTSDVKCMKLGKTFLVDFTILFVGV